LSELLQQWRASLPDTGKRCACGWQMPLIVFEVHEHEPERFYFYACPECGRVHECGKDVAPPRRLAKAFDALAETLTSFDRAGEIPGGKRVA
jgi:hypothetical protein